MSSAPSRGAFDEALNDYWHNRPPGSFEDVMALYGVLAVAESGGGLFKTPSKLEPFIDDGRLLTISVDLTGAEPEYVDVTVDKLREDAVDDLGYSHKSSGRGAKYSLTQIGSKNGNDAEGVASTILGRIASWTRQDSTQSVTGDDGHPDGWIVNALATVFDKDGETFERIGDDIQSLLPDDDSIPTAMTVRLKVDPDDVDSCAGDDQQWVWPADLEVLEEAMKRYASANAADKNIDSGKSEGQAVGVVSGTHERVVGTPESPLDVFSVKHPDAQPGLRRTASWRHYPVSADVAMLFAQGQDLIERCVYRRGGKETYALPYFAGEISAEKAEALYLAIQSVDPGSDDESQEPPMAQVTFRLQEHEDEAIRELAERELRFYTVTMPISDDKHIISETPAATTYHISAIADALVETVRGPTLDTKKGGFQPYENWPLLDLPPDRLDARRVAFGRITGHDFTDSVFADRDDEEGDDFRRIVDHRHISGQSLEASTLFGEYIRRYRDETEDDEPPSELFVAQMLVHLETLARAGYLTGIDSQPIPRDTAMTEDFDTSDIGTIRTHRLDNFLNRPLFENNQARLAAALAGVLVGQVSWHQESERDISRPLDAGTRGDQLTTNSLETALTAALEKAKVYAHDSDRSFEQDVLFPETVDRLLEATDEMPTEWTIDKRELQFCYVLGHAHGRRSMPVALDMYESADSASEATTDGGIAND